jgi:hypothetical protein
MLRIFGDRKCRFPEEFDVSGAPRGPETARTFNDNVDFLEKNAEKIAQHQNLRFGLMGVPANALANASG